MPMGRLDKSLQDLPKKAYGSVAALYSGDARGLAPGVYAQPGPPSTVPSKRPLDTHWDEKIAASLNLDETLFDVSMAEALSNEAATPQGEGFVPPAGGGQSSGSHTVHPSRQIPPQEPMSFGNEMENWALEEEVPFVNAKTGFADGNYSDLVQQWDDDESVRSEAVNFAGMGPWDPPGIYSDEDDEQISHDLHMQRIREKKEGIKSNIDAMMYWAFDRRLPQDERDRAWHYLSWWEQDEAWDEYYQGSTPYAKGEVRHFQYRLDARNRRIVRTRAARGMPDRAILPAPGIPPQQRQQQQQPRPAAKRTRDVLAQPPRPTDRTTERPPRQPLTEQQKKMTLLERHRDQQLQQQRQEQQQQQEQMPSSKRQQPSERSIRQADQYGLNVERRKHLLPVDETMQVDPADPGQYAQDIANALGVEVSVAVPGGHQSSVREVRSRSPVDTFTSVNYSVSTDDHTSREAPDISRSGRGERGRSASVDIRRKQVAPIVRPPAPPAPPAPPFEPTPAQWGAIGGNTTLLELEQEADHDFFLQNPTPSWQQQQQGHTHPGWSANKGWSGSQESGKGASDWQSSSWESRGSRAGKGSGGSSWESRGSSTGKGSGGSTWDQTGKGSGGSSWDQSGGWDSGGGRSSQGSQWWRR